MQENLREHNIEHSTLAYAHRATYDDQDDDDDDVMR